MRSAEHVLELLKKFVSVRSVSRVEDGEVVGRVKNTMLAGNVYEALMRISAVGEEPEWTGSLCAPPVLVDGLYVVSKEGR